MKKSGPRSAGAQSIFSSVEWRPVMKQGYFRTVSRPAKGNAMPDSFEGDIPLILPFAFGIAFTERRDLPICCVA
jgi:hypothetical protein